LYVIGGYGAAPLNDVQYAAINTNGTIGSWIATTSFTSARYGHTSVAYNGYLYVTGGLDSTHFNDVQYAPLSQGRPSGSVDAGSSISSARWLHASAVNNNYVYVTGGASTTTGTTNSAAVRKLTIGADGFLSSSAATTSFTTSRNSHTTVAHNGYLYVIGGWNGSSTYYNTYTYAPIDPVTGDVSGWSSATTFDTTARKGHASFVYNNRLYIVGGSSGTALGTVLSANINGNGSLGSFTSGGTSFTAREGLGAFQYNGYLYVVGGNNGGTYYNDIQYASINPTTGALGTFNSGGNTFNNARTQHSTFINNGFMYVLGGWNGTTYFADIQYATLNAGGTVGTFSASVTNLTAAKRGHTSVVNNGIVYTLGGYNGTAVTTFTELSRIGSPPSSNSAGYVARYERTFDTGSGGNTITGFTVAGTTACSNYSVSYKTATSSGVYGALTTLSSVPANTPQTLSVSNTRYLFLSITLNDTSCGAQSSITSIGVSYNVVPSIPTLLAPAANATGISVLPEFRLGTTDADGDSVQYRIYIYSISTFSGLCTLSIVKTIDQNAAQAGWTSQSLQSGTAYPGMPPTITQFAVHQTQTPALSPSTDYCWAAQAIDPLGSTQWSALTASQKFTTDVATKSNVNIGGGTTICGGTNFSTGP
jgi:hypothetical protein